MQCNGIVIVHCMPCRLAVLPCCHIPMQYCGVDIDGAMGAYAASGLEPTTRRIITSAAIHDGPMNFGDVDVLNSDLS